MKIGLRRGGQSRKPPMSRLARAQRGFSVLEVLIGGVFLAIGLLGHVSSALSTQQLSEPERTRSQVLRTARQFMERLRSDEDWTNVYTRLRALQDQASKPGTAMRLRDGRQAWKITAYHTDLLQVDPIASLRVLVDVPSAPLDANPTGPAVLREDIADERFGLPADLDGDGKLDGSSRNDDHVVLPIVATFHWRLPNGRDGELRVSTWLRGNR